MDRNDNSERLEPGFGQMSTWAFSIGTAIGWGSLVVTCNTYLASAGIIGTILGLIIGMFVILIVTNNIQYLICSRPDSGGICTFVREVCGYDHGFLTAWFLLLTYISILWANITSVPVFARYFLGDVFRFGFSYSIFGYEVYLGEALLSIVAVSLTGLLCALCRKTTHVIMIISALAFVVGFTVCTVAALFFHGHSSFSFDPFFLPDSSSFSQIAKIAAISPWAFIGFENIAHFSEEYSFPVKRVRKILFVSVIMTTSIYLLVTVLSVTAYPPEYATWFDYVKDMGNLTGFKAVPAFYAIDHYLGSAGVTILMTALFGAILTSLIGNTMALSRLLYANGRDGAAPGFLSFRSKKGNPSKAVLCVVLLSVLIPFLGRTAIGWIVDVTTLGATLIYALLSYAVYRDAKTKDQPKEKITGLFGMILMLVFVMMLLLPNILSYGAMASESYMLFYLWALIGLVYFKRLVTNDRQGRYGHSVLVWEILLMFVLFASMMWVTRETEQITDNTIDEIHVYYSEGSTLSHSQEEIDDYLKAQSEKIHDANEMFTIASFAIFIVAAAIIMSNYQVMKKREQETSMQLGLAEKKAITDQLTGVKNRHAYSLKALELDERIRENGSIEAAIVVCDVNNLKFVNDNYGHKRGDEVIYKNCMMICKVFKSSPVYRTGGDEFVVILENDDYRNRTELIQLLDRQSLENEKELGTTVAVGMSEFRPGEDEAILTVFNRADELMYERKAQMKAQMKQAQSRS